MKSTKTLIILFSISLLVSCGESDKPKEPTFEDKAEKSISKFLNVDSISDFTILDTITKSRLDTIKMTYQKVAAQTDSQLVRLPELISATKERLAKAEENLANASSSLFTMSYQDIIEGEKKNLASFEETLSKATELKSRNDDGLKFVEKASESASDKIAYLMVQVRSDNSIYRLAITEKLEVLKNFSEE